MSMKHLLAELFGELSSEKEEGAPPTTGQPTTGQPITSQPTTDQPTTDQPTARPPTTTTLSAPDSDTARVRRSPKLGMSVQWYDAANRRKAILLTTPPPPRSRCRGQIMYFLVNFFYF